MHPLELIIPFSKLESKINIHFHKTVFILVRCSSRQTLIQSLLFFLVEKKIAFCVTFKRSTASHVEL